MYWNRNSFSWGPQRKMQRDFGTRESHTRLQTADDERISDRDALKNATTLTVRGLDGKVLRSWVKSGSAVAWVKDYVYAGGSLLASVAADPDEGTRSFALDHLGTPRLVTNACKTVVAQHAYYPFGMEATSSSQDAEPMKFTGQERDLMATSAQTDDLDNMHARSYNPDILRFISLDPLRGDPRRPQSFNLFAYVQGNPANYTDPLGLQTVPCLPGNPLGNNCKESTKPLQIGLTEETGVTGQFERAVATILKGGTAPVPTIGGQLTGPGPAQPSTSKAGDRPCNGGFGGGIGVLAGGNADLGLGLTGLSGALSGGLGAFYETGGGLTGGPLGTGVTMANAMSHVAASPPQVVGGKESDLRLPAHMVAQEFLSS